MVTNRKTKRTSRKTGQYNKKEKMIDYYVKQ